MNGIIYPQHATHTFEIGWVRAFLEVDGQRERWRERGKDRHVWLAGRASGDQPTSAAPVLIHSLILALRDPISLAAT